MCRNLRRVCWWICLVSWTNLWRSSIFTTGKKTLNWTRSKSERSSYPPMLRSRTSAKDRSWVWTRPVHGWMSLISDPLCIWVWWQLKTLRPLFQWSSTTLRTNCTKSSYYVHCHISRWQRKSVSCSHRNKSKGLRNKHLKGLCLQTTLRFNPKAG